MKRSATLKNVAIVAGCLLSLGYCLHSIYGARAPEKSTTFSEMWSEYKKADPAAGMALPKGGFEFLRQVTPESQGEGPSLIFALGECNTCSLRKVSMADLDTRGYVRTVALYLGEGTNLHEIQERLPAGAVLAQDKLGIQDALNSFWTPRLAVISAQGRLVALQELGETPYDFVKRGLR